jgi:hypothetical protein
MGIFIDLTGRQFERLTVVNRTINHKRKGAYWLCRCVCGKETIVATNQLNMGYCKSCGCLREENKRKRITHGASRVGKHEKLYDVWASMKGRCYIPTNTSYARYGALGISVCKEWLNDYKIFKEWAYANGFKDELTLDRIDSKGNYAPNNCKWSTVLEQANNKKNNVHLTYKGITKTLPEWAREYGLSPDTLRARLYVFMMPVSQALEKPLYQRRKGGTA